MRGRLASDSIEQRPARFRAERLVSGGVRAPCVRRRVVAAPGPPRTHPGAASRGGGHRKLVALPGAMLPRADPQQQATANCSAAPALPFRGVALTLRNSASRAPARELPPGFGDGPAAPRRDLLPLPLRRPESGRRPVDGQAEW